MANAIVITGADGLLGSHLCDAFAAAGWDVRATDLPDAACEVARAVGASVSHLELARPEGALALAELSRGAKLLVHASFPREAPVDLAAAKASVRAACAAALSAGAPLLLLSSCSVYGRPRNLPCDEGELKAPVDAEGEARWAVEVEAFHFRRTRGLKLVVLRPALTYGPGQRRGLQASLVIAALAAWAGHALWVPRRGPVMHTVHAVDVAQAALLLAQRDLTAHDGRAFNVADDVPLPLEELARAVLDAAGARSILALPYWPATTRFLLWVLRKLPHWMIWAPINRRLGRAWLAAFAGQPKIPPPRLGPELLEQISADRYFDTHRLRALGFSPRQPSAVAGLAQLARESRARGWLPAPRG